MAQTFDFDIGNVVGPPGATGNGIKSIALLSTSGLVKTYRITMTDDTIFDFNVSDGEDGNGISGASFDPQTNALTITFDDGSTFTTPSLKGVQGDPGDDGYSPAVTITTITGGHRVTITDEAHPAGQSFDVMDGEVTEARLAEALATKAPVILETASGAIASFDDGADGMSVKKLVAQIEPVQDLHGYSNPWPAGGGVNLLDPDATMDNVRLDNVGETIAANGWCVTDYIPASENTNYYCNNAIGSAAGYAFCFYDANKSFLRYYASSGQGTKIANSGTDAAYLRATVPLASKATVIIAKSDSAVAFSPYSNECPISGWTGANIRNNHKDILSDYKPLDLRGRESAIYAYGSSSTGAIVTTSGDVCAVATYIDCSEYRGKQLTINYRPVGQSQSAGVAFYDANKSFLNNGIRNSSTTGGAFTFTVPDNQNVVYLRISVQYTKREEIMMWAEEESQTLPINWQTEAGTIYGGTVTLNEDGTGTLKVEKAKYIANANKLVNFYNGTSTTGAGYALDEQAEVHTTTSVYPDAISSICKTLLQIYWAVGHSATGLKSRCDNETVNYSAFSINDGYLTIYDPDNTISEANFKEKYNSAEFVYKLATPITYHFDNIGQLYTFLGTNNVWIDTGAITECDYPADTKTYVDDNGSAVTDVQINGTSILSGGVANIPVAKSAVLGVVKADATNGIAVIENPISALYGYLTISPASEANIKAGSNGTKPVVPSRVNAAAFYGLAKAAGDTTQSASANAVGAYTEDAKSAIHEMLNGAVTVSGTTPTIAAKSGITYVCGEVATLDITPPASGIFEVQFVSGSTPTVLTATGVTWVNGFDPTALESNKTYDISISNGIGVAVWI